MTSAVDPGTSSDDCTWTIPPGCTITFYFNIGSIVVLLVSRKCSCHCTASVPGALQAKMQPARGSIADDIPGNLTVGTQSNGGVISMTYDATGYTPTVIRFATMARLQSNQLFDFCPQRVALSSRPGIESCE